MVVLSNPRVILCLLLIVALALAGCAGAKTKESAGAGSTGGANTGAGGAGNGDSGGGSGLPSRASGRVSYAIAFEQLDTGWRVSAAEAGANWYWISAESYYNNIQITLGTGAPQVLTRDQGPARVSSVSAPIQVGDLLNVCKFGTESADDDGYRLGLTDNAPPTPDRVHQYNVWDWFLPALEGERTGSYC